MRVQPLLGMPAAAALVAAGGGGGRVRVACGPFAGPEGLPLAVGQEADLGPLRDPSFLLADRQAEQGDTP